MRKIWQSLHPAVQGGIMGLGVAFLAVPFFLLLTKMFVKWLGLWMGMLA